MIRSLGSLSKITNHELYSFSLGGIMEDSKTATKNR